MGNNYKPQILNIPNDPSDFSDFSDGDPLRDFPKFLKITIW